MATAETIDPFRMPTLARVTATRPKPGTPVWNRFADGRALLGAGAALLIQVSHPTIGAGVGQFSDFKTRPLGRFFSTLDYVNTSIYGDPADALEMGQRVRNIHKTIKGVDDQGRRYHALEPEAYAFVHASLAYTVIEVSERYIGHVSSGERHWLWAQWRELGSLVGVRERDLPSTYSGFVGYLNDVVEDQLEATPTAIELAELLKLPVPLPLRGIQQRVWAVAGRPAAELSTLVTIDLLPVRLRERLGLSLSLTDRAQLAALRTALRGSSPLLGSPVKQFGPRYFNQRRDRVHRVATQPPVRVAATA